VGSLGPVLTVFASWWLLDEAVSLLQLGGLALVMLGVTRLKPPVPASGAAVPAAKAASAAEGG
jgi:hypothetical protein